MAKFAEDHMGRILRGFVGIGVVMLMVIGLGMLVGVGRMTSLQSRILGACIFAATIAIMLATVRRWAGYFIGLCVVAAAQAVFALVAGHTLTAPFLITNKRLVSIILLLLVLLTIFSYRFASRPPQSRLDAIALVAAVVGLFAGMMTEPDLWPVAGSAIILGIAWAVDRRRLRSRSAAQPSH